LDDIAVISMQPPQIRPPNQKTSPPQEAFVVIVSRSHAKAQDMVAAQDFRLRLRASFSP
jgi:hypothetical protein